MWQNMLCYQDIKLLSKLEIFLLPYICFSCSAIVKLSIHLVGFQDRPNLIQCHMATIEKNDRPVPVRPTEHACTTLLIFAELLWISIYNHITHMAKWILVLPILYNLCYYLSIQPTHCFDSEPCRSWHQLGLPKPRASQTIESFSDVET